jgi:hypothetical protein
MNTEKERRCTKCDCEMVYRESWLDMDGEYRYVQYLYCSTCDSIYSCGGELLLTSQRFVLTSNHS